MSINSYVDSVSDKQGPFHPRAPRSKPLTTKGHAPGIKVGNDVYPEFHAQVYPAGTAPKENTFQPNAPDIPRWALNPEVRTYPAADDFPGATSADVYAGLGKPLQGQTSRELHGGKPGRRKRKKERAGLEGVGASGKDNFRHRRLDVDPEPDSRGKTKNAWAIPGAEERWPVSAEQLTSKRR
ncbi:hypothetical protein CT0861_05711 [Colletotrichum tofieldiae]|uniref:Uncharacterized protein n=1 Tax=Colletotrichum tofieldiae TaxID=708197 RepID=A0A166XE31_9PEZI|nr:hypothetical protein CT0861_05711 [Colletotrichum tofieldiae]GKT95339.1 hypothetical protein Ct61P_13189 [Colletotrichum tofieldiae]